MAAHIVTILKDIRDRDQRWDLLEFGMGHAGGFDLMDYQEWEAMLAIVKRQNREELLAFVSAILPTYEQEWQRWNYPATYEEWVNRKYDKAHLRMVR